MIKVLHVVTQMNRAGLENRIMDIYREINRNNVQFDFYTNRTEAGLYDSEIKNLGGAVYYSSPISKTGLKRKEKEFLTFLQEHKEYKIIHSHVNEWSTVFCKAAKKANVPIRIAHSRGANQEKNIKRYIKDIIKLPLCNYANFYFAVSKKAAIHLFNKKTNKKGLVQIWPNAIDCKKYRYSQSKRDNARKYFDCVDDFVVIHVGNFSKVKNHSFLIQIFKEIHEINNKAILLLAGEGEELDNIKNLVISLGIEDKVRFLGSISEIKELLAAGDVFVFPSFNEGFPGSVLEAEAAGLPCVISDTITPEVVLVKSCTQLPLTCDAETWAKKALELSEVGHEDNYFTLKEKGYDVQSVANSYEKFYINCLLNL